MLGPKITSGNYLDLQEKIWNALDLGHFLEELGWCLAISSVKYSILAFYWRLFASRKQARKVLYACLIVVTCWIVANVGQDAQTQPAI